LKKKIEDEANQRNKELD